MEVIANTKFCINCKHYINTKEGTHLCGVNAIKELNLITGEYIKRNLEALPGFRINVCRKEAIMYESRKVD